MVSCLHPKMVAIGKIMNIADLSTISNPKIRMYSNLKQINFDYWIIYFWVIFRNNLSHAPLRYLRAYDFLNSTCEILAAKENISEIADTMGIFQINLKSAGICHKLMKLKFGTLIV